MADEADAAQKRGELATNGQHGEAVQSLDSLGLDRSRVANGVKPAMLARTWLKKPSKARLPTGDQTEQVYRDALEKRRKLMETWAAYCEPRTSADVHASRQCKPRL
jgi:hypothetical protein